MMLEADGLFSRFARSVERQVGRSSTFAAAIVVVILWAATGPVFGWSDTWQLIINTLTTVVTFLVVFLIQNAQTRDTMAMQAKLDELIRVNSAAHNSLIRAEERSETEFERIKKALCGTDQNGNPIVVDRTGANERAKAAKESARGAPMNQPPP